MDYIQIIIIISISSLTFCLVFLTVWIVRVLKQLKDTFIKANLILDDAKLISQNLNQPLSRLKDFFIGLKEGINFLSNLFKKDD